MTTMAVARDEGNGHPVVLLHGFPAGYDMTDLALMLEIEQYWGDTSTS